MIHDMSGEQMSQDLHKFCSAIGTTLSISGGDTLGEYCGTAHWNIEGRGLKRI